MAKATDDDESVTDLTSETSGHEQPAKEPETMSSEAVETGAATKETDEVKTGEKATKIDGEVSPEPTPPANKYKRFLGKYWAKKKWTLPVTALALILIILIIPVTRYASLGLFLKGTVTVSLVDSTTNTPVSSAAVTVGGHSVYTNAEGKVTSKLKFGAKTLTITKQYYKTSTQKITVTFSKSHNTFEYKLVANGRQVPITVTDKITGKPIAGAEIVVLSPNATASKTDKTGKATIVLPTKTTTQKASVTSAGFNGLATTIQVTGKDVAANHLSLTPSGKLYFLSNQSGKIDVVKTNLDGTDRQTVLAGTGLEEPYSTSLLASQDWKYLVLLAHRTGDKASVYMIDTSTGQLTTIDEGNADFTLVGWLGDTFAYYVNRGYDQWQPKNIAIKTYDAGAKKLNVAYETGASGDAANNAHETLYWIQEVGTKLVWFTSWGAYHNSFTPFTDLDGKSAQVVEYDTARNAKRVVKTYSLGDVDHLYQGNYNPVTSYRSLVYAPDEIYFQVNSTNGSSQVTTTYDDEYEDGLFSENNDEAKDYFTGSQDTYPTYLLSPSNKQTFWSEERDGKNALFVGDANGKSGKQIASLSEYQTYGWYTDNYLLVTKNSSELYIMAADGKSAPQKISDYYKPPTTYRGYGGGYGGL